MKELDRPYRPFLVCYDDNKVISNHTRPEFDQLIQEADVNWATINGEAIDNFQLETYRTYLELSDFEEGKVPGNKEIAEAMTEKLDEKVSRGKIARTRKEIARKFGFKPGW